MLEKRPKKSQKLAKSQNWLKTHSKVINAQNKCLFHHFGGMLAWKSGLRFWFGALEVPFLGAWTWAILAKIVKSAHVQAPKNGTSSAPNQKRRPPFHANILPKWWNRHLFHAFFNFGWVLSKFWKIAFFGPFWAVFLWARTQKLAGDVRGQFKSQWLNPNIF